MFDRVTFINEDTGVPYTADYYDPKLEANELRKRGVDLKDFILI